MLHLLIFLRSSSGELEVNKKEQDPEDREKEKVEQDLLHKMYEGKINKQVPKVRSQSSVNARRPRKKIAQNSSSNRKKEWYRRHQENNSEVYKRMVERSRQRTRGKALGPESWKKDLEYNRSWRQRKREQDPQWHQKQLEATRERNLKRKTWLAENPEARSEAMAQQRARYQQMKEHDPKAYFDKLAGWREIRRERRIKEPEWAANEREKARARDAKRRQRIKEEASLEAYLKEYTNKWAQGDSPEAESSSNTVKSPQQVKEQPFVRFIPHDSRIGDQEYLPKDTPEKRSAASVAAN